MLDDGAYHFYPEVEDAAAMLRGGGFRIDEQSDGDGYAHFLLTAVAT